MDCSAIFFPFMVNFMTSVTKNVATGELEGVWGGGRKWASANEALLRNLLGCTEDDHEISRQSSKQMFQECMTRELLLGQNETCVFLEYEKAE